MNFVKFIFYNCFTNLTYIILYLYPDTIVQYRTLYSCIDTLTIDIYREKFKKKKKKFLPAEFQRKDKNKNKIDKLK